MCTHAGRMLCFATSSDTYDDDDDVVEDGAKDSVVLETPIAMCVVW